LLGASFITSMQSILCRALTWHNTTENYLTHTKQDNILAQCIFNGIHWLLITNKGRTVFPNCKLLPRSTANSTVSKSKYTGWLKKWTQLKSKRRLNTRQTVGCGIPSSLLALRVDLRALRSKLCWIHLRFSSDTRGRPELLPLHREPICLNWWFQRQMLFLVGGWMLKRRRNARCTVVADSVLMNSRT